MSSEQVMGLLNDLHLIASQGETPGGDGVTVNVQLWAERWIDRLSTPAAGEDDDAIDDVLHNLDSWCRAYPVDIFPEPEDADLKWLHATKPGLCDRISASMGRHMVKHMREMADTLKALREKANG